MLTVVIGSKLPPATFLFDSDEKPSATTLSAKPATAAPQTTAPATTAAQALKPASAALAASSNSKKPASTFLTQSDDDDRCLDSTRCGVSLPTNISIDEEIIEEDVPDEPSDKSDPKLPPKPTAASTAPLSSTTIDRGAIQRVVHYLSYDITFVGTTDHQRLLEINERLQQLQSKGKDWPVPTGDVKSAAKAKVEPDYDDDFGVAAVTIPALGSLGCRGVGVNCQGCILPLHPLRLQAKAVRPRMDCRHYV